MFAPGLFDGQRILVTGGGTGLGRAMAAKFLELGAEVVICGRRDSVLADTASELMEAHGGLVEHHALDIRNAAAVDEVIGEIFAVKPLTGLVNNAAGNFIARTEDVSPKGFDAVANIVMRGTFYVTHAVGTRWIKAGQGGSITSILVTWVRNGGPFTVPSAMSKAAIDVMTKSLAAEWGRYGIRLNGIAPGEIPTEGMNKRLSPGMEPGERTKARNPMGRPGTMEELQNLAAFLMSDGCQWLSGETIAMDGAQALGTGGNFYELRAWGDAEWQAARAAIEATNAQDRKNR
ncbi:MAG: SDR family oxidoreductase [Pseudomonadota bacterium]